ncbi:MAG TPA: hypothetical protein DD409_05495 [Bacteroidales bacterium]|jgi:hypothetical protein|nr:hypothetical protein [Bacteroidales bacterium]
MIRLLSIFLRNAHSSGYNRANDTFLQKKEVLIRGNRSILWEKEWLKQHDEGGLKALARTDVDFGTVLPEVIKRTKDCVKKAQCGSTA